jgi:Fe-S-cluster containining protein
MEDPFYSDGLRFSCSRCSSCCRGGPGYVFLSKDDLGRILACLQLDFPSFFKKYCSLVDMGTGYALSLAEKKNYDCIFWEDKGCALYENRPIQCSTFPFWSSILGSRESWDDAGRDCPGIGHGELRSREYIEESLWARRAAGTIILGYEEARKPESIDADTLLGR